MTNFERLSHIITWVIKRLSRTEKLKVWMLLCSSLLIVPLDLVSIYFFSLIIRGNSNVILSNSQNGSQNLLVTIVRNLTNLPSINLIIIAIALFSARSFIGMALIRRISIVLSEFQIRYTREIIDNISLEVNKFKTSDLYWVLGHGVFYISNEALLAFIAISSEALLLISVLVVFLIYSPINTLLLTAYFIVFLLVSHKYLGNRINTLTSVINEADINLLNQTGDYLRLRKELHLYKTEEYFKNKISADISIFANSMSLRNFLKSIPKVAIELSLVAAIGIIVIVNYASGNPVTEISKSLSLLLIIGLKIGPSLLRIQSSLLSILSLLDTTERISQLSDEVHQFGAGEAVKFAYENVDNAGSYKINHKNSVNQLQIENLTYGFPDQINAGKYVLETANLIVNKGEVVALVGRNGIGKSTFFNLLLGFEKPNSGRILFDNIEMPSQSSNEFSIGYVPQKISILDLDLVSNIALGVPSNEVNLEHVNWLINLLGLENLNIRDIDSFGEDGKFLSGGEKQKIGLARALYFSPGLLLLDEFTSAQDSISQEFFAKLIDQLKTEMIIIIISHDQSFVKICDKVIELTNGKLVEISSNV